MYQFDETSGQIITTSAEVTLNGGLVMQYRQNPLNSGLGNIVICPETWLHVWCLVKTCVKGRYVDGC